MMAPKSPLNPSVLDVELQAEHQAGVQGPTGLTGDSKSESSWSTPACLVESDRRHSSGLWKEHLDLREGKTQGLP